MLLSSSFYMQLLRGQLEMSYIGKQYNMYVVVGKPVVEGKGKVLHKELLRKKFFRYMPNSAVLKIITAFPAYGKSKKSTFPFQR